MSEHTAEQVAVHRRDYVRELGYERAVCVTCRVDWPCPTYAQKSADGILPPKSAEIGGDECGDGKDGRPEWGTEDYRRYAALFNDIGRAPKTEHVLFSVRHAIADYLWAQGWRRDVRPEDVTEHSSLPGQQATP